MIVREILEDNPDLIKTYSDEGFYIRNVETGEVYDEAIDVLPLRYTYEETDEPINEEFDNKIIIEKADMEE